MTMEIELTQDKIALVDDGDYDWLNQWKWYPYKFNKKFTPIFYAGRVFDRKTILMHRLIMGFPSGLEIDHIDRNSLNNVRGNLRIATHHQNHMNTGKHSNNKSGYKGVSLDNWTNKWVVRIDINGHRKNLGRFDSAEEAALAYNEAAKKYYGEFAWLNKVPDK